MLIVSKGALQEIEAAITSALIGAVDHHMRQVIFGTIDPEHLHRVALGALVAATGETVLPHGTVIEKSVEEHPAWLKITYPRT